MSAPVFSFVASTGSATGHFRPLNLWSLSLPKHRSDRGYRINRAMSFPKASTISNSSSNIPTICAAVRNLSLGFRPVTIS